MAVPDECGGLRILVVDDNVDYSTTMAMLLRVWGHHAKIASNGSEAIDAAWADKPDVVLLDIGLPGVHGYDVARQLSGIRTTKTPLIIAVTGFSKEADQQNSVDAGIDLHLLKPVDPDQLQAILRMFQTQIQASATEDEDGPRGTEQS
jgi:two-component system OmpR family response regulator